MGESFSDAARIRKFNFRCNDFKWLKRVLAKPSLTCQMMHAARCAKCAFTRISSVLTSRDDENVDVGISGMYEQRCRSGEQ